MSRDTAVYNVRRMQDYYQNSIMSQTSEDIVFEVLKKSGDAL